MMELRVPRDGLHELYRNWSGEGDLYNAVSTAGGDDERSWTPSDVRARSQRVLLGKLEHQLNDLPSTVAGWGAVIPISSESSQLVGTTPRGGVNWSSTARRFGWPPRGFALRRRHRAQDETALATLAWLADQLSECLGAARPLSPLLAERVTPVIDSLAAAAAAAALLDDTSPRRPDRSDLLSLQTSGRPWPLVASLAALVLRSESDWEFLAFELLEPDPEAAHRLFHLSTFGQVVQTLRTAGFRMSWLAPVGGSRPGPRLVAVSPDGSALDLWFEAAGARAYYGLPKAVYSEVVKSVSGAGGPIGSDVALIEPGQRALLLECKWSDDVSYVARDGYHQAVSYALDARSDMARTVWSFVVGPVEVVPTSNTSDTWAGNWGITVGSTAMLGLPGVVREFLAEPR